MAFNKVLSFFSHSCTFTLDNFICLPQLQLSFLLLQFTNLFFQYYQTSYLCRFICPTAHLRSPTAVHIAQPLHVEKSNSYYPDSSTEIETEQIFVPVFFIHTRNLGVSLARHSLPHPGCNPFLLILPFFL